jgi:hypothetical protein
LKDNSDPQRHRVAPVNRLASGEISTSSPNRSGQNRASERRIRSDKLQKELPCNQQSHQLESSWKEEVSVVENCANSEMRAHIKRPNKGFSEAGGKQFLHKVI